MTPDRLIPVNHKTVKRTRYVNEELKGVILYADVGDKSIEENNILTCIYNNVPCWPKPSKLIDMLDRHKVMNRCIQSGFVDHKEQVYQMEYDENYIPLDFPFVIKTGNEHRGLGKYLITKANEIPIWEGVATIEPFFTGTSVRILILGDSVFGIRIDNANSWIANSPGAEASTFVPDDKIVKHAKEVTEEFGLDVAGVDYIMEEDGTYHFLEINQYPGLDVSDEVNDIAAKFLNDKMNYVEGLA